MIGVTASALADRLGIDRSTLRRWTLGGEIPRPDRVSPGGRRLYSPRLADAIAAYVEAGRTDLRWRLAEEIRAAFEAADLDPPSERHAERVAVSLLESDRVVIL